MDTFFLLIAEIARQSWFWQGIIINTSFSLGSIPFTNKKIQKLFRNRKKNRIKDACNELKTYCLKQLIRDKYINKDDFENQLYIVTNRYELDIKDVYNDKNIFLKKLTYAILEIDLLDDNTKEKISDRIRKDKIFIESDNENDEYQNSNSTLSEETEYSDDYNEEDVELNENEKKDIRKYTVVITAIIFTSLLLYTCLSRILIKAYGVSSVIFINIIIIILATIPILVNSIIHFKEFNEQNKTFFGFLVLISILNVINFICIVGMLYQR